MKKPIAKNISRRRGGSRILASLREAVDWVEGKDVAVRVTTVEAPVVDVKATRQRLGLSQAAFAAKFGFQAATLRSWEQGRTYPDGAARVLLGGIANVTDALTGVKDRIDGRGSVAEDPGVTRALTPRTSPRRPG
jgi:putative transcriptional regulator